jgi:cell wall-associated NlpC family hydrolase
MGQDVGTGTGAQVLGSGQLQPGDDIAFQMNGGGDYDHIGIYIGNGEMVAAPSTGDVVQIQNLNTSYWLALQWSARRFG